LADDLGAVWQGETKSNLNFEKSDSRIGFSRRFL